MADSDLKLISGDGGSLRRTDGTGPCRSVGCAATAASELGFCSPCRASYDVCAAKRGRLVEAVCARLVAAGDPLFFAFGSHPRALEAHVLAHLEELGAPEVHVPRAALHDDVDEIDERFRGAG